MTNWALATALPLAVSAAMATSPFIWEKRVIVMRADAASNAKFQQQRRLLLADRDALRDLVERANTDRAAVEKLSGRALKRNKDHAEGQGKAGSEEARGQ